MKDNKVVDKLVSIITKQFDIDFDEVRSHSYFEDGRVPGQYGIRIYIGEGYLEYACRHAVPGRKFKAVDDIIEINFSMWPPESMEFNELFSYFDEDKKKMVKKQGEKRNGK